MTISAKLKRLAGDTAVKAIYGKGISALVIKVASAGTSYLMLVAFANLLSPEDYGYFGYILNLSILLSALFGLGLPTAIMRFWPTHMERAEPALARGAVKVSLLALAAATALLTLLGVLLSLMGIMSAELGFAGAWIATALLAATFAFGDYLSGALRAQGNTIWALAPRDIFWRVAAPLLAISVLYTTGISDARTAILSCLAVMVIVCVAQIYKHIQLTRMLAGKGTTQVDWKAWTKPLLPLWWSGVLYALIQQFDVIVVGTLLGPAEAGAYFAAQKTASLLGLVMIAGGMVAAPMMAASFHAGRMAELQRLCRLLAIAIAVSTLAGLVLMAVLGNLLLTIFDPTYVSAYGVLMVLSFGFAVDAMAGPSAYLMQMTKLEWTYLRIMAVVYGLVLALQVTFVPRYGILAAAAASAFGVVIWNVLAIHLLRKEIGIDPSILSALWPPKSLPQDNAS
ncbi:MAG: lipopolysaccharide biosynthesis protein [Phyllobacteriaceae bacterium]|nr:lipopolysaccharide biosynthesis protein [Phyllobacteriaceae bacterium]